MLIALLSACGGEKGKMRLKGELGGLRQGELLIWNNDGDGGEKVDTIHVESGSFEYEAPAGSVATTWTLVYPNMSTLTIFASSGDVLKLSGKAGELRRVKVTGNESNELYTDYRMGEVTAADLISQHPTSIVARHVFRTEFLDKPSADYALTDSLYCLLRTACESDTLIASWQSLVCPPLAVGDTLPPFEVQTAAGDTLTLDSLRGRYTLIGVWASWEVDSRTMLRGFRDEKRRMKDSLQLFTICVDADPATRQSFERMDSIRWPHVNSHELFAHPMLRRWRVQSAPFCMRLDTACVIQAMGRTYEDIKIKEE